MDYRRCPRSQTGDDAELCVQLYGRYQSGYLPYAGGWLDQPPVLAEVFALVASEVEAIDQTRKER